MTERCSPGIERELAEKINLHLQLGKSGPGFHLSDDDLCMIVKALLAPCSAATESLVEQVASAIDEAVAKWQPGSDQRIREMAARAAIAAVRECQLPKCNCPGSPLDPVCAQSSPDRPDTRPDRKCK